ncbi:MAG TPA: hypothetical protein VJZ27_14740, partial [Aggregatilineales bacterium]|nr:hypothetical protein [Aggregatilineales bacterium]
MRETFKTVFKLDVYSDPVERRRALTLYWILGLMTAFIVLVIILGTMVGAYNIGIFLLLVAALLSQVSSIWLARRGYLEYASWLAVSILFVSTAVVNLTAAADSEGIRSDGIWIVLLIASLLVKPRITLVLVTGYIVVWVATFIAAGDAPAPAVVAGNENQWQIFRILTTLFFGGLIWFVSRNLQFVSDVVRFEATNRELILTRTSTEVSQHIFTRLDLETLLSETVELIRKQFEDIYHAQVFLIDGEKKMAVLRASTGTVGRALIEKKHALAVGSTSVIGSVTQSGYPVLVEDTGT